MPETSTIEETLKEYGRGIIGSLLFSLPLIYTMEVWLSGFIVPPAYQLSCIVVTFLLLLGYNTFSGMRKDSTFGDIAWDSVEEIGLAIIVSFIFLYLIDVINIRMSFDEITGKVIIESMIVAIGISIGTAKLGENAGGVSGEGKGKKIQDNRFIKMMVLSICGAILFSSSVAPTEEILMIAVQINYYQQLLLVLSSLILSSVILYFSNFMGSNSKKVGKFQMLLDIVVSYSLSLLVSFLFLWFFNRIENYDFNIVLAQMIVLGVPASIGASAGRLLIDE